MYLENNLSDLGFEFTPGKLGVETNPGGGNITNKPTSTGACPCDCQEITAQEQWYLMKQCQGADCYPVNVNTKRTECKPIQQKKIFDIPCEQVQNLQLEGLSDGLGKSNERWYDWWGPWRGKINNKAGSLFTDERGSRAGGVER